MIKIIKGRQRKGKTTLMIGMVIDDIDNHGYQISDVISLVTLFRPDGSPLVGYTKVSMDGMRKAIRNMVETGARRKIYVVDEIDRVFSHRFWQKTAQAETLLGLWQDEKLENKIYGTAHLGKSIDNLIRESMQYLYYVLGISGNKLYYKFLDIVDRFAGQGVMVDVDLVQKCFDTNEPVK